MCEYHFRKWHTSQTSTQHFTLSVLVKEKARLGPPCVYIATGVIQWLYKLRVPLHPSENGGENFTPAWLLTITLYIIFLIF